MYEFLLLASAGVWAITALVYSQRSCASMFHPLTYYLAFHFLIFVLRPPLVYFREYNVIYRVYEFQPSIEDKATVLIAANLGLIAFAVMVLRKGSAAFQFKRTQFDEVQRALLWKPFMISVALLLPIAVLSLVSDISSKAVDATTMVRDAATGIAVNTSGNGYFVDAQMMLAPLALTFAWLLRFRWWSLLPLLVFIGLRGMTGGRGVFVLSAVALALLFLYDQRRTWPVPKVLLGLAALVAMFNFVGQDRGAAIRALVMDDYSSGGLYGADELRFLEGMDAGNLEYFEYLVYVIPQRSRTYGYFLNNLQILTEPIPRGLWPDKPIGAPIQLYKLFDYGFPIGMTNSLPGEGWAQLGYLGVALWCGLFGYLWGAAFNSYVKGPQTNFQTITYMFALPISILFFRDGTILTFLKAGFYLFMPLLILRALAALLAIPSAEALAGVALHKRQRQQAMQAGKSVPGAAGRALGMPKAVPRR